MQIHAHINLQFVTQTRYKKINYNCTKTSLNSIYSWHFKSIPKFDRMTKFAHKTNDFLNKKKYLREKDSSSLRGMRAVIKIISHLKPLNFVKGIDKYD